MKKALVFGDSHVAKIFEARNRSQPASVASDIEFCFICAPGLVTPLLTIANDFLLLRPSPKKWNHPTVDDNTLDQWHKRTAVQISNESGSNRIDLKMFDYIFIVGGRLIFKWHLVGQALRAGTFSSDCIRQTCKDVICQSMHFRWLEKIRSSSKIRGKIVSIPEPLINESSPELKDGGCYANLSFHEAQIVLDCVLKEMGSDLLFMPTSLLNKQGYAVHESFKSENNNDFKHVNINGAQIVFNEILRFIQMDSLSDAV